MNVQQLGRQVHRRNGFTLIELSILLVIIGLVIGGILVGQDLIKAAAISRGVSRVAAFETAVNTFRLKYDCLPGDCSNAVELLGALKNGNGNGIIDRQEAGSNSFTTTSQYINIANLTNIYSEPLMVYDHLARANLIAMAPYPSLDPATFRPGTHWISILDKGTTTDAGSGYSSGDGLFVVNTDAGMLLNIGGNTQAAGAPQIQLDNNNLSPNEMRLIDTKIDDGLPRSGAVWAQGYDLTLGIQTTAAYDLAASDFCQAQVNGTWQYINVDTPYSQGHAWRTSCFFFKRPGF